MSKVFDIAIIGSGFSGSILAWILAKKGRRVALIDAQHHPRFAIGESSTPIADLMLRRLGQQYGIDELVSMATYGRWKRDLPNITCGAKRGFSYFVHAPGKPFDDSAEHCSSLLVAASASQESSDTHWYRSEVDHWLFDQAISAGAIDWSGWCVDEDSSIGENRLRLENRTEGTEKIAADWIIDASGQGNVMARLAGRLQLELETNTRSVFAHYENLGSWREALAGAGIDTASDPFDCDAAAQHHLIGDRSWIWMLRLDNNITSVGMTSANDVPLSLDFDRFPSLRTLFENASVVFPRDEPRVTTRLQRLYDPVVHNRAIMLPTAAVTIDPLHSTGIAHALSGVSRVAKLVLDAGGEPEIAGYRNAIAEESRLLDRLVATAYETMDDFKRFTASCMIYFAGAIACEERILVGDEPSHLWNADDEAFVGAVQRCCKLLRSRDSSDRIVEAVAEEMKPWNNAGLFDPSVNNRYAYTATKD